MAEFALHPQLQADTAFVADWDLSRVLLMNDARYPWIILVPRRAGLAELHDLTDSDASTLTREIRRAGTNLKSLTEADKINTAALGNQVPQLHVHIIARRKSDAAWPNAVWGRGAAVPYSPDARDAFVAALRARPPLATR